MNKKLAVIFSGIALAVLPVTVFAINRIDQPEQNGITDIWSLFNHILDFLWPLFIAVAVLMFIFAGFTFLTANGDPGKVKTAQHAIIWAIVGVVVALLAFSLSIVKTIIGAIT
jgi:hypothetical protein